MYILIYLGNFCFIHLAHPAFSELVMKIGGPAAETALSAIASKQKIEDQEKTRNLDDVVRGLQK